MSTSEEFTNDYCKCPCGKGRILQHVDSPDNAWSRTTYQYELKCETCLKEWVVDDDKLHNRSANEASSLACKRLFAINNELKKVGADGIDQILADLALSFEEEHLLLKGGGICTEGPIRFKRARKGGVSAGSMCMPELNAQWIASQLKNEPLAKCIAELAEERAQCETRIAKARQEMNTRQIASLRDSK